MSSFLYNTLYLAWCAGLQGSEGFFSGQKNICPKEASAEFYRRLAIGDEESGITLAILQLDPEFKVLEKDQEDFYDGPEGPQKRFPITKAFAFESVWIRHFKVIDRGRDVRSIWYEKEPEK